MRILVISNTPFLPPSAGNRQRIRLMIECLRGRGWEVGMLLLPDADAADADVRGMRERLDHLDVAAAPHEGRRGLLTRIRGRVAREARTRLGRSFGVDDWCPHWFRERTLDVVRRWTPDVVIVEYVFLSACLDGLAARVTPRCLTVIDTLDVMHLRREVYARRRLPLEWFHTTYAEERRGLARADVLLAIQEDEALILRRMAPGAVVVTVPHGHPVTLASPGAAQRSRLLLVGSDNTLNVEGLAWFLDAVWPALRAAEPAVELVVCGGICRKVGSVPQGVALRGFVPSLDAEYAAARVVINPVVGGTGLHLKVAEALCHGRPVVSTAAGAAGIESGVDRGVLVADDRNGFASAITRCLRDDRFWMSLVSGATAHAVRRFSPEAAFGPLVACLDARVGHRQADGDRRTERGA